MLSPFGKSYQIKSFVVATTHSLFVVIAKYL